MLLPKPELKKGEKHLAGKTDVGEKLPQTPVNQLSGGGVDMQSPQPGGHSSLNSQDGPTLVGPHRGHCLLPMPKLAIAQN